MPCACRLQVPLQLRPGQSFLNLVCGHSILAIDALRTLSSDFKWSMDFWIVANHSRPIGEFKPSVVLATLMEPGEQCQLFPVPGGRGAPGKGRGRGRGRGRGAGRGRAFGALAGAGDVLVELDAAPADIGGGGGGAPLLDVPEPDEALPESDIENAEGTITSASESGPDDSDKDHSMCKLWYLMFGNVEHYFWVS